MTPWRLALLAIAVSLTSACGEDDQGAKAPPRGAPPRAPIVDRAAPPEPPPSREERAKYWLDRIVKGPEPADEGAFKIGNYHQILLEDAIRSLVDLGGPALDLLADPALVARWTTAEDANPWHGILDVLLRIGKQRPAVARAWAVPALSHPLLTLRRRALPVIVALEDPADGPLLLDAITKDADDRTVAPTAFEALFHLGPPWDARAARAVFERGRADLWAKCVEILASSDRGLAVRADFLAWFATLAGSAGPLASASRDAKGREVLSSDPAAGPVVGPEHAITSGERPAAAARAALGEAGFAAYVAALGEQVASADSAPSFERLLRLARAKDPNALATLRKELDARLVILESRGMKGPFPTDSDLASLASALQADESTEAKDLLARLFRSARPAKGFQNALTVAYRGLKSRDVDVDGLLLAAFRGGDGEEAAFAVEVLRLARNPAHGSIVQAILSAEPAGPRRHELRSLLLWIMTGALEKGGVEPEALAGFAREVSRWVAEGGAERGFASGLLELGPPGEAAFAEGLGGAERAAYVAALEDEHRLVAPAVVQALLAPIGADTPDEERRETLAAAFRVAPGSASASLAALARRLRPGARAEAQWILRVVRFRAAGP